MKVAICAYIAQDDDRNDQICHQYPQQQEHQQQEQKDNNNDNVE